MGLMLLVVHFLLTLRFSTDCGYICAGDKTEFCGAGNRLSVYKVTT